MRRWVVFAGLLLVALAWPRSGEACYSYSYAFDKPTYSVSPGGLVDVSLYLVETIELSGYPSQLVIPGDHTIGLFSTGVKVSSNDTTVASLTSLQGNVTDFSNVGTDLGNGSVSDSGLKNGFAPEPYLSGYRVLLGTFTFTGVTPGTSTLLTASDTGIANLLGTRCDPDPFDVRGATARITDDDVQNADITNSPEPSSFLVWGLFAGVSAGWACFRQRPQRRAPALS